MANAICKRCGTERELTSDNFERTREYKGTRYFRKVCIPCQRAAHANRKRERERAYRREHPLVPPDVVTNGVTFRICKVCNAPKVLESNYRPHGRGRNGQRHTCRACKQLHHCAVWQKKKGNLPKIMLMSAKMRAKRDGLPFEIVLADIVIPELCPVFGKPLVAGSQENHEWSPTLDKRVPSLGYVRGNICVISHRANMAKHNLSLDELKMLVAYLERPVLSS